MEMPLSFLESGISFSILQWRTAMDIRTYLKQQTLITDGAMGTYYSASYPDGEELAERENLLHPERIRDIHGAYIRSGARCMRTNTFAVNSGFFSDRRSMREYILAGYRIAEEAVEQYGTPGRRTLSRRISGRCSTLPLGTDSSFWRSIVFWRTVFWRPEPKFSSLRHRRIWGSSEI